MRDLNNRNSESQKEEKNEDFPEHIDGIEQYPRAIDELYQKIKLWGKEE